MKILYMLKWLQSEHFQVFMHIVGLYWNILGYMYNIYAGYKVQKSYTGHLCSRSVQPLTMFNIHQTS